MTSTCCANRSGCVRSSATCRRISASTRASPRSPWLDPERIGPFRPGDYLGAFAGFGVPTLLLVSACCFALATLTRSLAWIYVGAVLLVVGYFVMRGLLRDPQYDTWTALIDPFGRAAISKATKYWTAFERNERLPPLAGLVLANRLAWSGIAVALFAAACLRFRFADRGAPAAVRAALPPPELVPGTVPDAAPRAPAASRGRGAAIHQAWALTRVEVAAILRSPAFLVLLGIGMLNVGASLWFSGRVYDGDVLPVTRLMVGTLLGAFPLFAIIIAIYYGGEIVWRDRERRTHEIIDATAAPDWAHLVPKLAAVSLALVAAFVVAVLAAIIVQLLKGYARFELAHYLAWFVAPGVLFAVELAVLSVFVQTLAPTKQVGWFVMLVYLIASIALNAAGYEHNLYAYGGTPDMPLSDFNGASRFWIGAAWFGVYWLAFAVALAIVALALWRRGVTVELVPRLGRLGARLHGGSGQVLATSLAIWVALGSWIFYNTNVLNRYETKPEHERWLADYERALLPYESVPQPRIVAVRLDVDLHPRDIRAAIGGRYTIENRTGAPLGELHLRWMRPLALDVVELTGSRLEREYPDFDYRIYRLDPPMAPGERRTLAFSATLQQRGFSNSAPLTRLVDNGTFLDSFRIAPLIGMGREELLTDRGKRRKYGLPPDLRLPALDDDAARGANMIRRDSDWVDADITVTTDADQTPIAPGMTVSDSTRDGRRTARFRTDAPINHYFSIQSARYAVARDRWRDADLAIYYTPGHDLNVRRMLDAMKASLELLSREFSPYQFKQARILEFPAYATFAESFANTIPYSESIGFIFDYRGDPEKIDMVTYVTAHEIAHQWWGHQVVPADQQGEGMLTESFAQYSALLVMERMYGREHVRKFLKYELDRYLRSRGGEVVEEVPLARVEHQPYIYYQKGALAMYWLKEIVGEDVVNATLRDLIARYAFKPAPYPNTRDFIALLRARAGAANDAVITDLFERITLYDARVVDARATRRADGRYDVHVQVDARKLYADGAGHETESALAEPFEIGVFSGEPGKRGFDAGSVLHLERSAVKSGAQAFDFVVDREPKFAGIDPFNKRIDRNSDDNLAPVATGPTPAGH
jgi:ABC-type transport system involved in multi-copper enzyme maturation permease subunit